MAEVIRGQHDNHVVDYDRDQLAEQLAAFMDTYRSTLAAELRMSVPVLVELALRIEAADTLVELVQIKSKMAAFMAAIRILTPKN